MKKEFVYVQPKSTQAKHRFDSMMDHLHSCIVEGRDQDKLMLASISGRYRFCMMQGNDDHWELIK